jgi:replicative DNA helicase
LGKSTLASQFGVFSVKAGLRTFFYSGELNDWQLQAWFERQIAGGRYINAVRAKSGYTRYTVNAESERAIAQWYEDRVFIYDNDIARDGEASEEEKLIDTLKQAIRQYDCKVLFIDNLMTAMDDDVRSDVYRLQSQFVKKLAGMAKAYEVLIVLIAHPRKVGRGEDVTFSNDDIAGSGNIPNLADVVLIYQKPTEREAQGLDGIVRKLSVTKNRVNGKDADIYLCFDEASKRIAEEPDALDFTLGWESEQTDPEEDADEPEQLTIPF